MRRPRDIDSELKTLEQKAKDLRARKVTQLGELVIGCGADALPVELLAGALLMAVATKEAGAQEAWRERGAAFFSGRAKAAGSAAVGTRGSAPAGGSAPPAARRALALTEAEGGISEALATFPSDHNARTRPLHTSASYCSSH